MNKLDWLKNLGLATVLMLLATQPTLAQMEAKPHEERKAIKQLNDLPRSSTSVKEWLVQQPAQQPQTPTPEAPTPPDEEPELEITVTGTRFEIPILDTPQSIQVVPQEVLRERGAVRLDEFTDNVSGVQRLTGGAGTGASGFIIRGFPDLFENLRNGFRSQGGFARDLANIDRVEVLKGPAAVLYGGGFQSGVVNTITKKPLDEPFYQPKVTIGSYDFYRGEIDLTGPLTQDRSLLYRLNAAYQNQDSFRDFVQYENTFIAPSLTWELSSRTTLSLDYEHLSYDSVPDRAFPNDRRFLDVRRSLFVGEPDLDEENFAANSLTYGLEHRFSDNWQFKQAFNALWQDITTERARAESLQEDGQTLDRTFASGSGNLENLTFRNEFLGKFNTGAIAHNLLIGAEYTRLEYAYDSFSAPIDAIDISNPVYGAAPTEPLSLEYNEAYGDNTLAIYVQDLVELSPNLKVAAGLRFDNVKGFYEDREDDTTINETDDSEFSPRLGIVYQPGEFTTLYASWSNSFTPQVFGTSATGETFEPVNSEQFEVGIRQEFFDKRLLASLALYQITRQNVFTYDSTTPDEFDVIQTGEQRSRGVELDISGEILPGWKAIATYAYTDAIVTKDNTIPEGDRLPNVPYNKASLWTTYEIQRGNLQGLGFGLGLVYVGDRQDALPNAFTIPSYFRTDAALFYRRDRFEAQLNFKNLFDEKYFDSDDFGSLSPQEPFTVIGSVSFKF